MLKNDSSIKKADILSFKMFVFVWLLIFIISAVHYLSPPEFVKIHDILRRFYYVPIIYAALQTGLRGGIFTSFIVTCLYLPHAFWFHGMHGDPAGGTEKFLEIFLYFTIAVIAGYYSDKDRKQNKELKKLLEEQKKLTELLVKDGKLKVLGEVVAGITHEIKNPLHVMLGTAEIIGDFVPENSQEKKLWKNHTAEIKRLQRIVEKYLDFAKPHSKGKTNSNIITLLEKTTGLIETDARKKNIKIVRKYAKNKPIFLKIDEDQIVQVILNILINAVNAMEEQGYTIIVDTQKNKNSVTIIIKNNGPPIPEEMRELIFHPFYSGNSKGSGLGLSLVSKLMSENGGNVKLVQTDEYTEFHLIFENPNSQNENPKS